MKRIALSVFSAALLSVAIAPLAQATSLPTQQNEGITLSDSSVAQRRQLSPLEQRRLEELDRNGNQNGSLDRPRPAAPADVERTQGTPSPLEQRRLDELDRNGNQNGSLNRPRSVRADIERNSNVQMSRLQQMRLNHLNNK